MVTQTTLQMKKLTTLFYQNTPLLFQNIGITAYGYYWRHRRFGGIFDKELRGFKEREYYSDEQWISYQTLMLRKLLIHANNTVPYYRELFKNIGLSKDFIINRFEQYDLPKIPALTKEALRAICTTSLLSSNREMGGSFFSSSGSTGTPTQILYSNQMHQRYAAANETRSRNWAGVDRLNARGMIGGRRVVPEGVSKGPFYRYNFVEKQVYFSAYHISAQNAANYAEAIWKYKLDYMTGYAMSNYFLARFFDENNIQVPQLKAVITSSEKLTPEMRAMFQKVYGCKTYDGYSGVEACGMITENEHGQLLISPDVGIMEILKEDGTPCKPGEIGEVYSTGLLNFDQPLIRYRIGDMVKLAENQHTLCGRNMAVVEEIIGRVEDVVIGKDGREMVRFHGIFINLPSVVEGQIIQYEIDKFEIKVVCSQPIKEDERKIIESRMKSQLGMIELKITQVDSIPRNQNGKFKAVISIVKRSA